MAKVTVMDDVVDPTAIIQNRAEENCFSKPSDFHPLQLEEEDNYEYENGVVVAVPPATEVERPESIYHQLKDEEEEEDEPEKRDETFKFLFCFEKVILELLSNPINKINWDDRNSNFPVFEFDHFYNGFTSSCWKLPGPCALGEVGNEKEDQWMLSVDTATLLEWTIQKIEEQLQIDYKDLNEDLDFENNRGLITEGVKMEDGTKHKDLRSDYKFESNEKVQTSFNWGAAASELQNEKIGYFDRQNWWKPTVDDKGDENDIKCRPLKMKKTSCVDKFVKYWNSETTYDIRGLLHRSAPMLGKQPKSIMKEEVDLEKQSGFISGQDMLNSKVPKKSHHIANSLVEPFSCFPKPTSRNKETTEHNLEPPSPKPPSGSIFLQEDIAQSLLLIATMMASTTLFGAVGYKLNLLLWLNSLVFFSSMALITFLLHNLPVKPWLLSAISSTIGVYLCAIKSNSPHQFVPVIFIGTTTLLACFLQFLAWQHKGFGFLKWVRPGFMQICVI